MLTAHLCLNISQMTLHVAYRVHRRDGGDRSILLGRDDAREECLRGGLELVCGLELLKLEDVLKYRSEARDPADLIGLPDPETDKVIFLEV